MHIGSGCLVSGLDVAQSEALRGLELQDLILQGHHTRLHGCPSQTFTLVGRLDSWEVDTAFHPLTALQQNLKILRNPGPITTRQAL